MHRIDTPFIAVCSLNENWGFLSTRFPNRTAGWGQCCVSKKDMLVYDFLNHEKTLMLITNQHTNVSHPKLLILPRGIPITWGTTRVMIWDIMRNAIAEEKSKPKNKLLFAASSKWGPRPQILRCISNKFRQLDFSGHSNNPPEARLDRYEYYQTLTRAYFGLGLPGLGYDCFRNWELMTLGTIVILEKGVGLDRTLWRLPALLVEDFDEVTPELLRVAYLEAVYRAKEFEFRRLTQSFWFSVIANVSASQSVQPMLDLFPMKAEDPNFTRPREPYECGKTNTCGKGSKRTPKSSC